MKSDNREIFGKMLALVRNELWGEPLSCKIAVSDVGDILNASKEQAVSGLVANAIIRNQLPIGDDLTLEVCGIQQVHEKSSKEMNTEVAFFAGFLNRRNLNYAIMKGQTIAALYPNPFMRTCGDIDFYCPQESFREVQKTIENKLGLAMKHDEKEKHDTFCTEGIEFEMHRYLTELSCSKHRKYWDREISSNGEYFSACKTIGGERVVTLSPTLNALFVFVHLFRHFSTEGEGIRHFCDWAMVLHKEKGAINVEELKRHLEGIGYLKAYRVMGYWLVHVLGLPKTDFPLELDERDSKWLHVISDNIYEMGNLGKADKERAKTSQNPLDSLSTYVAIKQAWKFYSLAPCEILMKIPQMIRYSIILRFHHGSN